MHRLVKTVRWLGLLLMGWALLAPLLAWFQMGHVVARYGLQQQRDLMFSIYVETVWPTLATALIIGGICFMAGRLMLLRNKRGWSLWTVLCGLKVVLWFVEVAFGEATWSLFFSGLLWLGLALMTMLTARAPGFEAWWTPEGAPDPS